MYTYMYGIAQLLFIHPLNLRAVKFSPAPAAYTFLSNFAVRAVCVSIYKKGPSPEGEGLSLFS